VVETQRKAELEGKTKTMSKGKSNLEKKKEEGPRVRQDMGRCGLSDMGNHGSYGKQSASIKARLV